MFSTSMLASPLKIVLSWIKILDLLWNGCPIIYCVIVGLSKLTFLKRGLFSDVSIFDIELVEVLFSYISLASDFLRALVSVTVGRVFYIIK